MLPLGLMLLAEDVLPLRRARLGLPQGETAEAYAKTVVAADFKEPRDADVIQKVQTDLAGKNITVTEAELRAELARGRRSPPATLRIVKPAPAEKAGEPRIE
jgi:hypothetical protein